MRAFEVDWLAREQMHGIGVRVRYLVMRQVRMEIERADILEQSQFVDIPERRNGRKSGRLRDDRGTQSPFIYDGRVECFDQSARVRAEPLLPGNKRIAVV